MPAVIVFGTYLDTAADAVVDRLRPGLGLDGGLVGPGMD